MSVNVNVTAIDENDGSWSAGYAKNHSVEGVRQLHQALEASSLASLARLAYQTASYQVR